MADKQSFDIKVDFLIPTTITYRVTAESAQAALKLIDSPTARQVDLRRHMNRRIKLKGSVYRPHSSTLLFSQIYRRSS